MLVIRPTLTAATAFLAFMGTARPLAAQNAEVDAVQRVIREETESYYRRDAEAWKGTWVNDSTAIRTFIASGSYSVQLGWEKFGAGTVESIRREPTPQPVQVDRTNYVVRIDGALAWAEYDERTTFPSGRPPIVARQNRTLVKRNGEWRILSAGSFVESSYGTSPGAVEERLIVIGTDLTRASSHGDAVRVLTLATQLLPRSAAAHLALGDAHVAAGETSLAIQSYEKSLSIDPGNERARAALAKVREKR